MATDASDARAPVGKTIDAVNGYTAMREVSLFVKNKNTKLMALILNHGFKLEFYEIKEAL